ncbi:MAG: DMT family transporter [Verrucomicrobiota bacterium]|jgi:drug/metabolite transporter (DMT)-like permease
MVAALLTTLLFAISAVCGYRTARQIGGVEANFWRITIATIVLTVWAFTFGAQFAGAPGWFMLSGFFGIGLGDSGYFQALPRLGSRRTVLLTQCLTAPFAAVIEWLWLGTKLNFAEAVCVGIILAGVAIALAPEDHLKIPARDWKIGIGASIFGAFGGALGAVVIRKGYAALADAGLSVDAGTTGYQRVVGGILIPTIAVLALRWRSARAHGPVFAEHTWQVSLEKWRRIWPWVVANALAGQTLGVTCMQWALKDNPSAVVQAIIATSPIVLLPLTRIVEGEKIGLRSLAGAMVAVGGVIGLTFSR